MTFAAQEQSREAGQVVELYEFIFGGSVSRFTSFNQDITFAGNDYVATQISRTASKSSTQDTQGQVTITVPIDNPVAQLFVATVPGKVGSIRILRGHANDAAQETLLLFDGFIANVALDGELEAKILCNPNTKIFKRSGPRFSFLGLCNHILYDERCKVSIGAFTFTGLVSAQVGNDITVNGAGAIGLADHFVGGFARFPSGGTDDARMILVQAGDVMTLLLPFSIPVVGSTIDLFAGCDHTLTTCDVKFAAALDYGGFPFVPRKNPFNTTLRGGS